MNRITFIIVTWNNEKCIIDCLNSIYKHCQDFEIIVVDNNSNDNTVPIIKKQKFANCRIIDLKQNLGFAEGNNFALNMVDTEYICYLNPDTILVEDIINPSIDILEKDKSIGLVGCKLINADGTLQSSTFNYIDHTEVFCEAFRIGKFFPNLLREKLFPYYSKSKYNKSVDWVIGAEMILKTEDAKKIDGFSTEYYMYAEDMDICKKINIKLNKKIFYLADTKLIHLGGISEASNRNYSKLELQIKNKIKFSRKFYGEKECKKVINNLINVYKMRLIIVKMFLWSKKRETYLEKMKTGYEISYKEKQKMKKEEI